MRNRVEVAFQVGVHDVRVACLEQLIDPTQGVFAAASGPESVAVFREVALEDRLDHVHDRRLDDAVTHRGNAQRSRFVRARLGDVNATNRLRLVRARLDSIRQFPDRVREVVARSRAWSRDPRPARRRSRRLAATRPADSVRQTPYQTVETILPPSTPCSRVVNMRTVQTHGLAHRHTRCGSLRLVEPAALSPSWSSVGLVIASSIFLEPFAPPALPGFVATMAPLTPAGGSSTS